MGAWGVGSDENDHAADALADIASVRGLYADAEEETPLEGQALIDAQDAALLCDDAPWYALGLEVGSVVSLLRDGFRVPRDLLERVEDTLRGEDVDAATWYDGGEARKKAIAAELGLLAAARANGNQLPVELRDKHQHAASKGSLETIAGNQDPAAAHGKEAVREERAERERERAAVVPAAPSPQPFGWLDTAGLNVVGRVAKHLGVPHAGMEKHEVVGAIKTHPKRWHARRFAPYAA